MALLEVNLIESSGSDVAAKRDALGVITGLNVPLRISRISLGIFVKKSSPVRASISSIVTCQFCQFLHSALLLIVFMGIEPLKPGSV